MMCWATIPQDVSTRLGQADVNASPKVVGTVEHLPLSISGTTDGARTKNEISVIAYKPVTAG